MSSVMFEECVLIRSAWFYLDSSVNGEILHPFFLPYIPYTVSSREKMPFMFLHVDDQMACVEAL
jgi:hypothetical protein